jgi:hypothetical protein
LRLGDERWSVSLNEPLTHTLSHCIVAGGGFGLVGGGVVGASSEDDGHWAM